MLSVEKVLILVTDPVLTVIIVLLRTKEFLVNSKNLEHNIPLIGAYLKEQGASEEIAKILVGLINLYSTLNNKIAKHHDKVDAKFLEFLMYQTGLFIRMLIVLKREST